MTGCTILVIFPAAAFSRHFAVVRAAVNPGLPNAPEGTMMMKKAGLPAEPRMKDELRAAARRARERSEQYEILADAQTEMASEPEESERGRTKRRKRRRTISSSGEKDE